jgi:hypothetical protein
VFRSRKLARGAIRPSYRSIPFPSKIASVNRVVIT